ncbi:Hypothetical protein SMAX5B_011523 [Scophthalmus maximus]|uniref:Uncharacterized protein n=1 Tax=Scophthalmus maximus TaxID=52904 RepID=A0A2U9BPF0_SCOMX|nr:Hypothetical protein SMAX5B_011523 [Scophthalmus maximus]
MAARMGQLGVYVATVIANPPAGAVQTGSQAAGLTNQRRAGVVPTAVTSSARVPQTQGPATGPQLSTSTVPQQKFMEFDIYHAPDQAAQAIPAGAPLETLEVLLPVDSQRQPIRGPVRGFIKQEILEPNGRDTEDVVTNAIRPAAYPSER